MPVANIVGQADNPLVDWQHPFWNRIQARRTHHRISLAEMERCSFINRLVSLTIFEAVKRSGQGNHEMILLTVFVSPVRR